VTEEGETTRGVFSSAQTFGRVSIDSDMGSSIFCFPGSDFYLAEKINYDSDAEKLERMMAEISSSFNLEEGQSRKGSHF